MRQQSQSHRRAPSSFVLHRSTEGLGQSGASPLNTRTLSTMQVERGLIVIEIIRSPFALWELQTERIWGVFFLTWSLPHRMIMSAFLNTGIILIPSPVEENVSSPLK